MKTAYFEKGSFLVVPNKEIVFKLRGSSLNVYLAIIDHANDKGECFPSHKRLAAVTGYTSRQCRSAIDVLVEKKLLKKTGRARDDGSQTSNIYQLMVIHSRVEPDFHPPMEPDFHPGGEVHFLPELNLVNSTYKELKERDQKIRKEKRSYALACRADEAQVERASAARSRKGSTSHLGELFATRV